MNARYVMIYKPVHSRALRNRDPILNWIVNIQCQEKLYEVKKQKEHGHRRANHE